MIKRKRVSKTSRKSAKQKRNQAEVEEIKLLNSWIESQKPDLGSNPMLLEPLPLKARDGRVAFDNFSRYAGVSRFDQLPISKKTKKALCEADYTKMTDIQRATLPHSLAGRNIVGGAKTGSGKTLAFVIPVLEKLYKERWSREDGVGSIIITPTRELANQTFDVLKKVGCHHGFSAGLLIGGGTDVEVEKENVNQLNILVCTPGRLLQHMDETPNFQCSQLQVLVLDEADRILDENFQKTLNRIISQLPERRQTFLFSATQTKSAQDLARLRLKNPEYLSVHENATRATPDGLKEMVMKVPLDKKLDMLWSFIKAYPNSRILVFLSTRTQVKFVFEAFKKLQPGTSLMCFHGKMNQEKRMKTVSKFEKSQRSVLFSTDVASRGLDFNREVDWVVQVDCPENVICYKHRVGRTARFQSSGQSLLFLMPSETKMLEKLQAKKIPIQTVDQTSIMKLEPVSGLLSGLLSKYHLTFPALARRAFITYMKSIQNHEDKEVFDVMKLPITEFSESMGLPMAPKMRFLNKKMKFKEPLESPIVEPESSDMEDALDIPKEELDIGELEDEEAEKGLLLISCTTNKGEQEGKQIADIMPETRILKKKKLKINIHRPSGTRVVFDEEGNARPPLANLAGTISTSDPSMLDELQENKDKYHKRIRQELKKVDKEDKEQYRQRCRAKRKKDMKLKTENAEEPSYHVLGKRSKIYSDDEGEKDCKKGENKGKARFIGDSISLEEQEALAVELLNSMHSYL